MMHIGNMTMFEGKRAGELTETLHVPARRILRYYATLMLGGSILLVVPLFYAAAIDDVLWEAALILLVPLLPIALIFAAGCTRSFMRHCPVVSSKDGMLHLSDRRCGEMTFALSDCSWYRGSLWHMNWAYPPKLPLPSISAIVLALNSNDPGQTETIRVAVGLNTYSYEAWERLLSSSDATQVTEPKVSLLQALRHVLPSDQALLPQ